MRRYPTVRSLAASGEADLLALWSGLGYYHRARNLLEAARAICEEHGGRIPADMESLRRLPGVGPYTAAAILSIGHNLPYPALDANITRVIARLGAIKGDTARGPVRRVIEDLARRLIPRARASEFNQALMDLGAMVCKPRSPSCDACPIAADCKARRRGSVERIPSRRASQGQVAVDLIAIVARRGEDCLLVQRGEGKLLGGMWEFPLVSASAVGSAARAAHVMGANLVREVGHISHTITRHRIRIAVREAASASQANENQPTRRIRSELGAVVLAGPASYLATPRGSYRARWVPLSQITGGNDGLALTGAARKIARLISATAPARPSMAASQ